MGLVQERGVAVYTFIRNTVDVLSYSEISQETIFVNNKKVVRKKRNPLNQA